MLLYQQIYDVPEQLRNEYFKPLIKQDIVLQNLNAKVLAVIENNLDKGNKDRLKLSTIAAQLLIPNSCMPAAPKVFSLW